MNDFLKLGISTGIVFLLATIAKNKNTGVAGIGAKKDTNFFSINWKEAKQLVESGQLNIIGSNLAQINNQGEYTISACGKKLYKRRNTASKVVFDLIAEA